MKMYLKVFELIAQNLIIKIKCEMQAAQNYKDDVRKQIEAKHAQQLLLDKLKAQQAQMPIVQQPQQPASFLPAKEQQLYNQIHSQDKGQYDPVFDQKPQNLFDSNFVQMPGQQRVEPTPSYASQQQPSFEQMSERERRIYLRDRERERRNIKPAAGVGAPPISNEGPYGGMQSSPAQNLPPASQMAFAQLSKRDQMLAAKAQMRGLAPPQTEQQPSQPIKVSPAVQSYTPFSVPGSAQPAYREELPSQELNQRMQPPVSMLQLPLDRVMTQHQPEAPQSSHRQQEPHQAPPREAPKPRESPKGNGLVLSNEEETRQRIREKLKRDYQDHLQKKEQEFKEAHEKNSKQTSDYQPMPQIGDHQPMSQQDKLRKQQEYRQSLEAQQAQEKAQKGTPLSHQKKKALADDIFQNIMDSNRGDRSNRQPPPSSHQPPPSSHYQPQSYQQQVYNQPPSSHYQQESISAPATVQTRLQQSPYNQQAPPVSKRQEELLKLQMQETRDVFGQKAAESTQEQERQKQIQKQREYAQQLNEQMNQKKQQLYQMPQTSSRQRQQPQQMPQAQAELTPFEQQMKNQMMQPSPDHQQQMPPQQQQMMQPAPSQQQQFFEPAYQSNPQSQKEEYRRILEQQVKEAQQKKQLLKEQQLEYDRTHDKDIAQVIQEAPHQQPGSEYLQRHTDVTRAPVQIDNEKQLKIQRYQNDLKQQMQEQLALKEAKQKAKKLEEQLEEERLERERAKLAAKEIREIQQDGGKVEEQNRGRKVNRSQFEQSAENGGPKSTTSQAPPVNHQQFPDQRDLFLNSPPNIEMMAPTTLPTQASNQMITIDEQNVSSFGANQMSTLPFKMPPTPSAISQLSAQQPPTQTQQFQPQVQPFMVQPHPQWQQPPTPAYQTPSPAYQQPPPQHQQEWQSQQASKMFEDQQKMIALYQQALEQILSYRNQYFSQAMEMRENILKEREQMLEFEKVKQAQQLEMQQLTALKAQLSQVQERRQALAPQITDNLGHFIMEQNEQIMSMSQSQGRMQEILREANLQEQSAHQHYPPPQQYHQHQPQTSPRFVVETSREPVIIEPQPHKLLNHQESALTQMTNQNVQLARNIGKPQPEDCYGHPTSDEHVSAQLDEIAQHVDKMTREQLQQQQNLVRSADLEISLNADTKLVKVPQNQPAVNNNDVSQQSQMQAIESSEVKRRQQEDGLLATWNENSFDQALPVQSPFKQQQSPISQINVNRSQSDLPPQKSTSPLNNMRRAAGGQATPGSHLPSQSADITHSQQKKLSTSGNLNDRKATITGSSFYDHTLRQNQLKAESQAEEMQKQMLRIFGNTTVSGVQNHEQDAIPEDVQNDSFAHQSQAPTPSLHIMSGSGSFHGDNQNGDVKPNDVSLGQQQDSEINIANTVSDPNSFPQQFEANQIQDSFKHEDSEVKMRQETEMIFNQVEAEHDKQYLLQKKQQEIELLLEQQRKQEIDALVSRQQPVQMPEQPDDRFTQLNSHHTPSVQRSQVGYQWEANEDSDYQQPLVYPGSAKRDEIEQELVETTQEQNEFNLSGHQDPQIKETTVEQLNKLSPNHLLYEPHAPLTDSQHLPQAMLQSNSHLNSPSLEDQVRRSVMALELLQSQSSSQQQIQQHVINQQQEEQFGIEVLDSSAAHSFNSPVENTEDQAYNDDSARLQTQQQQQPDLFMNNYQGLDVEDSQQEQLLDQKTSKKEQEMLEIAALIRKAQATTNQAVESAHRREQTQMQQRQQSQALLEVPRQHQTIQEDQDDQYSSIGQPREEPQPAQEQQQKSNNILADLDKIISNLEAQKNMATFGLPEQPPKENETFAQKAQFELPPDSDGQSQNKYVLPSDNSYSEYKESVIDIAAHSSRPPTQQSVQQEEKPVQQRRWKTLQEARNARPQTQKSNQVTEHQQQQQQQPAKKAPLAPKTPPHFSEKGDAKSRHSSRANSPLNVVGQYSRMALQQPSSGSQNGADRSQTSKSPQRVGQFASMAMQAQDQSIPQQTTQQDRSITSRSPQRVGKYTQQALENNSQKQLQRQNTNRSQLSKSPSRVGKFAQMAMQGQSERSQSPGLGGTMQNIIGKYASLARQGSAEQDVSEDDLQRIQRKYSQVQQQEQAQSPCPSILRPVSGSYSGRYQPKNGASSRPQSQLENANDGGLNQQQQQNLYMSDEEEQEVSGIEDNYNFD